MDERRGDNHASTEVSSEQIHVQRDAKPGNPLRDDGEEGREAGGDQDDEEGGDSSSQSAIVLIFRRCQRTDDIFGVGGGEVDITGIETWSAELVGGHAGSDVGLNVMAERCMRFGESAWDPAAFQTLQYCMSVAPTNKERQLGDACMVAAGDLG